MKDAENAAMVAAKSKWPILFTVGRYAGKAFFLVGIASSAVRIYTAENRTKEAVKQAGGWFVGGVGATYCAAKGGILGAKIGLPFGGIGAPIGAIAGGLTGAAICGYISTTTTEYLIEEIYEFAEGFPIGNETKD